MKNKCWSGKKVYNGVLNVYKEKGYTSHDVVAKLRGILKQKKIGHTGTLDPDAQGVLPVCLGSATKLCDMLTEKDKIYETILLLGCVTDTQDITGKKLKENIVNVTEEEVVKQIQKFEGKYAQIPPMYSAIKINGKKLYELAREGKEIERKPREVTIHKIEILSIDFPRVKMRVSCSKGTYIRTLCHDIGQKLECGACMEELLRTKVSFFSQENSFRLSEIEEYKNQDRIEEILVSVEDVLSAYKKCFIKSEYQKALYNGNPFSLYHLEEKSEIDLENPVKVYDGTEKFVGVFQYQKEKRMFFPVKMFLET